MTVGRIRRVHLRDVWKHEAHDFTTWLEKNIDVLNEHLDIAIDQESVKREQAAGVFSVDLVAEDDNGDTVVIENQLERSDHDHLGKVMTYLAAFDAPRAIWIVGDPRPEHVRAVAWLNDSSSASIWLLKVEAICIGDSAPAPLLTTIVGPSVEAKKIAATKQEDSARHGARRAFWERLLERAASVSPLHTGINPKSGPYLSRQQSGTNWTYGVREHGTRALFWIERGADREAETDAIYNVLLNHRAEIESAFGAPLEWDAKEGNRSRKIGLDLEQGGWSDPDLWNDAIDATVDAMTRLEGAISPFKNEALAAASAVAALTEVEPV